jgi:CDP-diacylglycerol---glycerol-3-phosphate 3-phosphatidyltransferase
MKNNPWSRDPIPESLKRRYFVLIDPILRASQKLNLSPNSFTFIGLLLSLIAAFLLALGHLRISAAVILFGGMFDSLDGRLARDSNRVTKFGALLDSSFDRYSEIVYFIAMAFYFIRLGWDWTSLAVGLALAGSMMVSYVRARAEGLGIECKVGILQRAVRLLMLGIGALIGPHALAVAVWLVAVLANVTAFQRIAHVYRKDKETRIA